MNEKFLLKVTANGMKNGKKTWAQMCVYRDAFLDMSKITCKKAFSHAHPHGCKSSTQTKAQKLGHICARMTRTRAEFCHFWRSSNPTYIKENVVEHDKAPKKKKGEMEAYISLNLQEEFQKLNSKRNASTEQFMQTWWTALLRMCLTSISLLWCLK